MVPMAKVLIATDGSDFAIAAAKRALALLSKDHTFTILTVGASGVPVTGLADPEGLGVVPDLSTAEEIQGQIDRDAKDAAERTVDALGIDARTRAERGDPRVEICRVAAEGGFDLVVVGSHGWGLLHRVMMGSVSHHVLHHAPCPVLVVRGE
jgi:nucleotide-binding universal stress UspA family protein